MKNEFEKIIIPCNIEDKKTVIAEYEAKGYILRGHHEHVDGFSLGFGPPDDYRLGDKPNIDGSWDFNKDMWIEKAVDPEVKKRLTESNEMMLYDVVEDMAPEKYQEWKTYRQELRGILDSVSSATKPVEIQWPSEPTVSSMGSG